MLVGIDVSAPWWMLLTIPATSLLIWWWRKDTRWARRKKIALTVLRASIFLLLILALAGVQLLFPAQGKIVIFVADQSASLGNTSAVWDFIRQAVAAKAPEDQFAVLTVGKEAVVDQSLSAKSEASPLSSIVKEHQTDLASGLRLAGGMIPESGNARIVLVSDGEETRGDAVRETKLLQERGIQVDTVHVTPNPGAEVLISRVQVPPRLFPGEEYRVQVDVESTVETEATLRLYDGNVEVGSRRVDVQTDLNHFTFTAEAANTGFHRFRAELDAEDDKITANNEGYAYSEVMGEPAVLVVEGTKRAAENLTAALEATGVTVDRIATEALPEQLESYKQYQSIVLADVAAFQFEEGKMALIRSAVRDFGVGLVMTGGKEAFGMGGWFRTPIEEALPVYMDLRDKEKIPSLGLILVIDKSGSMGGAGNTSKIELAKEAAIRATQMLSPQDEIGVVAFDGMPWWVVEPTRVDDVQAVQEQIGSITADGGTDIFPALVTAYEQLRERETQRKHIILLTDGQSGGPSQYEGLIDDMVQADITLSTVAVGTDADTRLLESIAEKAKGRYYFVRDDTTIPTIFSKETALATRTYMVEQPFLPQWTGGADWAEGLEGVPPLGGYIATTPKERAERVLMSGESDPVAARWTYGLGRSVAWTSDLSGHWSAKWVSWPSFSPFVNRMVNWTFPQYEQGEWHVETSQTGGNGKVTLTVAEETRLPEGELQVTVVHEDLTIETMPLKATAPGTFEAEFPVDVPGSYMLQVSEVNGEEVLRSGTYGMAVPYSPEYRLSQNGGEKMQAIAEAGNGKVLNDPEQAFAKMPTRRHWERQPVGQWCLLFAVVLLPLEIAVRRLHVFPEWFIRMRQSFRGRAYVPRKMIYSQALERLNERKVPTKRESLVSERTERESPEQERSPLHKSLDISDNQSEEVGQERVNDYTKNTKEDADISSMTERMNRLLAAKKRGRR